MSYRYALATTPDVDRRILRALADVLAEDRRAAEAGDADFGQVIGGRSEPTIPTPGPLVSALRQTLEDRILGGQRGGPIVIRTVEPITLDILRRVEESGARLVAPDPEDGDVPIQILHLQHLLRLAHAAVAHIPPPPEDDGTIRGRVATPEESARRERLEQLTSGLVNEATGLIRREVPDTEIIVSLARSNRGEFGRDVRISEIIAAAHHDLAACAESSLVHLSTEAWRYRLTSAAVAERFADTYHEDLKYVPEAKIWRYWDGIVWSEDIDEAHVTSLVKSVVLQIASEISATVDAVIMNRIADKKVSPLLTPSGVRNVLSFAAKDRRIRRLADDFDADPYLLNLVDGVVDLRTGSRRLHAREDLITRTAGIVDGRDIGLRYDPTADCPRWRQCLTEWFVQGEENLAPDHETIRAIQERSGYWLSGLTREHEYCTWFGPKGRNGKGVFKNVLLRIAGQYGVTADTSTFVKRGEGNKGSARGDLAALHGKRLVFISEPAPGDVLDEEFVKRCTGDDRLSFRHPYGKKNLDFFPEFKIIILANHALTITGADSIWDRQKLITWHRRFEDDEQDRDLESELGAELPGILNWAIEGFRRYQERGRLHESPSMVSEKKRYERSQTPHWVEYVEDRCILRRTIPEKYREKVKIHKRALRDDYLQWCVEEAVGSREQLGRNKFYAALITRYGLKEKNEHGVGRVIDGITTKQHFETVLSYEDRRILIESNFDYSALST